MTKARILADYVAGGTTAAEFDYMDGVTSNVQTQMDAKAPLASPTFTGLPVAPALKLTPTATGSAPSGSEGSLYYDSTKNSLMAYDTSWKRVSGQVATGGTITKYSGYVVHTFLTSGFLEIFGGGGAVFDVLVVAGGGSAGTAGGGGGGGGMIVQAGRPMDPGIYYITIGQGGAEASNWGNNGSAGTPSKIESYSTNTIILEANGGGGGSHGSDGGTGGSGGGPGQGGQVGAGNQGSASGDSGTYGHGNNSGAGNGSAPGYPGGGGGGAGAAGGSASAPNGGNGGNGLQNNYRTGSNVYYAGGGGGGSRSATIGTPGLGGANSGAAGSINTGGGGASPQGNSTGYTGGSGIVVIRYAV